MAQRDRIGQQLGNYRLTRLLGHGGFAEVYLGEHTFLGTMAAIKILRMQVTENDIAQFQQEARLLASLKHPSIVRILDFGIDMQTPYLVMEYAPNGTLRTRHPKGSSLPISTVVGYVKQIAEALQYAHERNVVHRDIKPENMLIGEKNEILLSDFGIALITHSSHQQSSKDMAGTVAYMAPEQIEAHPRPASDQYSLGVVVYEWLCGTLPFHGSYIEIAMKHRLTPPAALRASLPALSPDVEHVVMTALAKQAQERFASVSAFATALEQASQNEFSTGSTQPIYVTSKPIASRRTFLVGAAVAAAIVVGGEGVFMASEHYSGPGSLSFLMTTHDSNVLISPSNTSNTPATSGLTSRPGDLNYVTNLSDDGIGSLRWALANAPDGSTITFDASLKGAILRPSSQQCRDLLIGKNLTIRGPGAKVLAISGNGHDRVFSVSSGVSVTISGLTIEKGAQGCAGYPGGGGIYNEGTLTLSNCIISNNSMPDGQGGGIDNEGTLTLTNCTVTGNSGTGGQNTRGGGIYNGIINSKTGGSSKLTLTNTIVTGNAATGAYGDSGVGGGIYNAAGSTLILTNSTITGNSATGPRSMGGGIYNEGTLILTNSTVTGNAATLANSSDIYNKGIENVL